MKNKKLIVLKVISILLLIGWMLVVFRFSADNASESKNISDEVTRFLFNNNISEENVENLSVFIRKSAHFILYTFGGIFISICFILNYNRKNVYILCQLFGTLYAISDEIHQIFVPGRAFMIFDIFIDSLGVFLGIIIIRYIVKHVVILKYK